jgi:hypothetical protein
VWVRECGLFLSKIIFLFFFWLEQQQQHKHTQKLCSDQGSLFVCKFFFVQLSALPFFFLVNIPKLSVRLNFFFF